MLLSARKISKSTGTKTKSMKIRKFAHTASSGSRKETLSIIRESPPTKVVPYCHRLARIGDLELIVELSNKFFFLLIYLFICLFSNYFFYFLFSHFTSHI